MAIEKEYRFLICNPDAAMNHKILKVCMIKQDYLEFDQVIHSEQKLYFKKNDKLILEVGLSEEEDCRLRKEIKISGMSHHDISAVSDIVCRVRQMDDEFIFTAKIKHQSNNINEVEEIEEAISCNEYKRILYESSAGAETIQKTRMLIDSPAGNGLKIELDFFHQFLEGLVVAEVEIPNDIDVDSNLLIPQYWSPIEVTGDKRYSNATLSREGVPKNEILSTMSPQE